MTYQSEVAEVLPKIRAIFFDLHHTLTGTRVNFPELTREAATESSVDLSSFSDEQLRAAISKTNRWLAEYQIENDVDIHWGTLPEQWLEANRTFIENLGLNDINDTTLIEFERAWKRITRQNWEFLTDDALDTLKILHSRGYVLGICTRRNDDPTSLLQNWKILELMSVVLWTAVPGFAKPSPYTLIQAAHQTGVNPRACAYVGNMIDADIAAAKNAEMLPVLTVWANPDERKNATEDIIVIDDLHQLLDIFQGPPS
jgi:phosphoglycolate phosphatase-like HAD superfamily hydrolase